MILAFIAGATVFAIGIFTGAGLVHSTQMRFLSRANED